MWDQQGVFIDMGTVWSHAELDNFLASLTVTIKVVIVEEYILFKNKAQAQAGSRMPASVAIGKAETFAKLWGAAFIKQPSAVKAIAERLTGQSTKGMSHSKTHVLDAFNHGEYWLIKNKIKEVKL